MSEISNNKRIAKNTVMLYIRMLLSMVVSLYTSRVVLNTLGVEDYGVYGVVGGVVTMFSFLNASMSGATSRFLTYEMGQGNHLRLKETFSSALIIHIGIALFVFILAETIGLWFVYNKLVIPEGRMTAAIWVYQFSVLSTMITITQVPYNASIIAHEKMDVYAYVEIANVVLKLLIVYLLVIGDCDKLILYAILVFLVSVIIAFTYRIYCLKKFEECKFNFTWNKEILKPMLSFSGWDLYGNMCVVARTQGTNILLNIFFGTILNAANSIAITVNGVVLGLANNILMAYRPQIIKKYSTREWLSFHELLINATKYSLLFFLLLTIPLMFEVEFVLKLWLGIVPEYTVDFCRIILILNCLGLINSVVTIGIHATGDIKRLSVITGTFFLFVIPLSYFFLKSGYSANVVYVCSCVMMVVIIISNLSLLKGLSPQFLVSHYLYDSIIKPFIITVIASILSLQIYIYIQPGIIRLLFICIVSTSSLISGTYFIMLDKKQRVFLLALLKTKYYNK
ncbi:polysaccharide biosynthesis protein [Dysgonomonas sp. 511]|uniref:polysaccharide biosynthesis protein n=1 Tax=Dysgonomonas sp. 511 TaxID=2302930 RepID=UPI0013D16060|nr:polysaccharide biosynthesis protein [Dysgonomonas sp. 511]NDV78862.1 polysaccharide biosynthesis protein [Dysgonomonas sp. 511]